jgi:hypothetical protein
MSLGGTVVELHRGGRTHRVTAENREQYCTELEAYRLREMAPAAAAVRRGLLTQLPPVMVTLMNW